jgi:hypothetical protein
VESLPAERRVADHGGWIFPLSHALHRHQAYLFQRLVIQFPAIALHGSWTIGKITLFRKCRLYYRRLSKGDQVAVAAQKTLAGEERAMKYVIWAIRFWYAAWMIPAGLEHFYHISSVRTLS